MSESTGGDIRRPLIVVVLLAIALCCSALASADRRDGRPVRTILPDGFGHFAAYSWSGLVHTVRADFEVPQPRRPVKEGTASTWIGAQARLGPAPFIQVGVIERALPTPYGVESEDWAFWSDTVRDYRPAWLFPVAPGDRLDVSLAQGGGVWGVSISDARPALKASFVTRDEGRAQMNLADWAQEDPGANKHPAPYQPTAPVAFSRTSINGRELQPADLSRLWMSTASGTIGPGPLRRGSFLIGPEHESAAGQRYVSAVDPFDAAQFTFQNQLATWTEATPAGAVEAARERFLRAESVFAATLRAGRWPADAHVEIGALASAADVVAASLRAGGDSAVTVRAAWNAVIETDEARNTANAQDVRDKLGLPSHESYR